MTAARPTSLAVLLALLTTILLGGCTRGFLETPPPSGSEDALTALLDELRALSDVAGAEGDIRQVDVKDDPDDWLAEVTVHARSNDLGVAAEVRGAASARGTAPVPGTTLVVGLSVPSGNDEAAAVVDPLDAGLVDVVDRLRTEPFVRTVRADRYATRVTAEGLSSWTEPVRRVRADAGGRAVTVESGESSVEVDAVQPGAALLGVLDRIGARDVHYEAGTRYGRRAQTGPTRPSLRATVGDPAATATTLATTADEAAEDGTAPRTSFSLLGPGSTESTTVGSLGLPLGSAEPQDLEAPDLPWAAADVTAETQAVRALAAASVAQTGVEAEVTTTIERCAADRREALGHEQGTRAVATALVPVFHVHEDAQVPFDRVTATWTAAGLAASGRATGLDLWTAVDPEPHGVAGADIRGTADGLHLHVRSVCVR
ncbi:hypothetical protein DEJ23_14975 [Curtobacterium sp. MCSS17_008]|uniref:hypothetical protein n=1 Tax=Curtobacterium sp. MCSS17_008 TaxID=2175647 RepID=UPI000DAAA0C3|nr:hypothetical protein [Curtobacterium sp. MCSS17_008]PZF53112.1 hypothetical protein DEJ23_14975 [Curtobacterium sp. MCSS17_008]